MIDLVRTLVNGVEVPMHEAFAMATDNPARAIGLQKGRLAVGADADLIVLSKKLEVLRTFVSGQEIFCR
jgi:N-acetylglucosamine-6-phosphate deacetylase